MVYCFMVKLLLHLEAFISQALLAGQSFYCQLSSKEFLWRLLAISVAKTSELNNWNWGWENGVGGGGGTFI